MIIIEDTNINTKSIVGLDSYNYYNPSPDLPKITKQTLDYGYVNRYFIGKINTDDYIETNARDFNLADTKFYKKIQILWKISGPQYNVYKGNILQTTGVINYNALRILEVQNIISSVQLQPSQYWRGF